MARTSSDSRVPEPEVFKSLGLQELCRLIQSFGGCSILDLGGARGVNIAFWSHFSPSIHVADLRSALPLVQPTGDETSSGPAWDRIMALPESTRFDVILAWDLLNYLEQPLVVGLIQYLLRFCRHGALLFALIYDRQQMPAVPTVFKIKDEESLIYESCSSDTRPCLRHQPREVQRMFAGFRVASSFRLRHGVQEYLFEYEGQ
jgi:hypothetical protein